jgi:hypothetical protein
VLGLPLRSVSCALVGSRLQCRWVWVSSGSGAWLGPGAVSTEHIGDRLGRAKHELGFLFGAGMLKCSSSRSCLYLRLILEDH